MNCIVLASNVDNPLIIFAIVIGIAAAIAILAFIIYKILHPKFRSDKEKPNEQQAIQEEMDRILKPIEDEQIAKEVGEYKENEEDE